MLKQCMYVDCRIMCGRNFECYRLAYYFTEWIKFNYNCRNILGISWLVPNAFHHETWSYIYSIPHLCIFPCLGVTEMVVSIMENVIGEAFKVKIVKTSRIDILLYKLYLRLLHIFVPLLKLVFSKWMKQGNILQSFTGNLVKLVWKKFIILLLIIIILYCTFCILRFFSWKMPLKITLHL